MLEILGAILALLAAILPPLIAHFVRVSAEKKIEVDSLERRSIDELHIGADRLQQPPSVQP
jgi:hypothetical protein